MSNVSVLLFSTLSFIGTHHNPLSSLHPWRMASFLKLITISSVQCTDTPSSPGQNKVAYPASDSLQKLHNVLCFNSDSFSNSLAFAFNLLLGSNPFSDTFAILPVGIITLLCQIQWLFWCGHPFHAKNTKLQLSLLNLIGFLSTAFYYTASVSISLWFCSLFHHLQMATSTESPVALHFHKVAQYSFVLFHLGWL